MPAPDAAGARAESPAGTVAEQGKGPAGGVLVGKVTKIQVPYSGKTPVQTKSSGKTLEVSAAMYEKAKNGIREAEAVSAEGSAGFKSFLKKLYEKTFQRAEGVPVANMTYGGEQYRVNIGRRVLSKIVSDRHPNAEKLALLEMIPEIVQNGEYVGSGEYDQHGTKTRPVIRYDYFETPVVIGGTPYIARFDVEVLPDVNNYRTHQVVNMDLAQPESRLVGPAPTALSGGSSPLSDSTLSEGADFVNSGRTSESGAAEITQPDVKTGAAPAAEPVAAQGAENSKEKFPSDDVNFYGDAESRSNSFDTLICRGCKRAGITIYTPVLK